MVFDRVTGLQVDPLIWLPPDLVPDTPAHSGSTDPNRASKGLTALYLSQPAQNCKDILRSTLHDILIWPDAADHGLALRPTGLPYVLSGCERPVILPLTTLRARHFARP